MWHERKQAEVATDAKPAAQPSVPPSSNTTRSALRSIRCRKSSAFLTARSSSIGRAALRAGSRTTSARSPARCAMRQWIDLPAADAQVIRADPSNTSLPVARAVSDFITLRPPAMLPSSMRGQPLTVTIRSPGRHDSLETLTVRRVAAAPPRPPPSQIPPAIPLWQQRARARASRVCNRDMRAPF